MRTILIVVVALLTAPLSRSPLAAQQAPVRRIDTQAQMRTAAQFSSGPATPTHSSMAKHASDNHWVRGVAIGGTAGAVVGLLVYHWFLYDRTNGKIVILDLAIAGAVIGGVIASRW